VRSADIDRGDLAGARGALDVPDDRALASPGLHVSLQTVDSDLDPLTTPDGAIYGGPVDRQPDGSSSRAARTSYTRMEACRQCKYVLHPSISTIDAGQPRGGRDGVAIFCPATGRRALCYRLGAMLLLVFPEHVIL
jgi:hypothetical protein